MKQMLWAMTWAFALLAPPVCAQDKAADTNMQILREEIRVDRRTVVAVNMDLSETEARAFWPIYDQYQNDLRIINDRLATAIVTYADAYNAGPIPENVAKRLLDEAIALDDSEVRLRREYAARLSRAIPMVKVARYMQIEGKIRAAIRYELAANIPLIE